MAISSYTAKSHSLTLLFDFLLVILIFLVVLLGIFVYSVSLSRSSGRDVSKIPQQINPYGKVGSQ